MQSRPVVRGKVSSLQEVLDSHAGDDVALILQLVLSLLSALLLEIENTADDLSQGARGKQGDRVYDDNSDF